MRATAVRSVPLALLAAMVAWTAFDLVRFAPPTGWLVGGVVLALAGVAALRGREGSRAAWHRASRVLLAVAFMGERLLVAGVDVAPMMAFLVLLMALAALHALERTFGPVYDAVSDADLLRKVDSAAIAAYARSVGLFGFTFAASLLLLSVIPLAAIPGRSLGLAFGLAMVLLLVIAWLAVSPSLPMKRRA